VPHTVSLVQCANEHRPRSKRLGQVLLTLYSDFLDLGVPGEKPANFKNYPKLASDSSGTLKIGFSVKFYMYI